MPGRPPLRRALVTSTAAAGAVVGLAALLRPNAAAPPSGLVDWEAVRRTAHARTGEFGPPAVPDAAQRAEAYDRIAHRLAPLVAEVVQAPVAGFPHVGVLDRRQFVDANLGMMRRLLDPLEEVRRHLPASRATALGATVTSRYMGELMGFLSRRVLGQYDPVLMLTPGAAPEAAPALALVEPNVLAFERRQSLPAEGLREWLVLHEVTHAWQFEAHPWLRDHIAGLMRDLVGGDAIGGLGAALVGGHGPGAGTVVRSMLPAVRGQLRAVGRLQAVMSVAEGHGNFVMHRVGRAHLPDVLLLERGFHARRAQRSPLEQLVLVITGMRMKMRQYELGEAFADAVVRRGGLELLNRVWEGPALLPTMAELRDPARWVARAG